MKDASKYESMLDDLMEEMPELEKEVSALQDAMAEAGDEEAPMDMEEDMDMEMEMDEEMPMEEDEEGMEFPEEDEEEMY